MANGIPSFSELYSGASIANRIGSMSGSLDMFKNVLADVARIEKLDELYQDKLAEKEKKAAEREKKRGKGRTIGGILGGVASIIATGGLSAIPLAIGVGTGSYVGQRATDGGVSLRTPFGDQKRARLKDIERGNASNIFFRQDMLKNVEKSRDRMNKYLQAANDRYDESIISSALSDTLTAYQLGGMDYSKALKQLKNLKHLPAVAKGDMSVQTFRGLQDIDGGKSKGKILKDRFGLDTKTKTVQKLLAPNRKTFLDPKAMIDPTGNKFFNRRLPVPANANNILKALEKPAQNQVSSSGVDNLYRNIINQRILEG